MEVSLKKIGQASRHVLGNLFHYYVYDMSEFMGCSANENGQFGFKESQFDIYWKKQDHLPYFIYAGAELAGFALIRRYPANTATYDIEQFFVLRKFKGKGVGKKLYNS